MILLEFDFTVAVKKGSTHTRADHVSRLPNGEEPIGVEDEMPDAALFQLKMVPKWSERVVHFLTTADVTDLGDNAYEKAEFLTASSRFQLISCQFYYLMDDGILRLVVPPEHTLDILLCAHISAIGQHTSKEYTLCRVLWEGFWWPTMYEDTAKFVHQCEHCQLYKPMPKVLIPETNAQSGCLRARVHSSAWVTQR